jgi:ATP-dependent DNA ligase
MIIRPDTSVQVSSFIAGHGIELFRLAKEKGLEGIMAKRAASTYQAWRLDGLVEDQGAATIRVCNRWGTEDEGTRKQFGALLLAIAASCSSRR